MLLSIVPMQGAGITCRDGACPSFWTRREMRQAASLREMSCHSSGWDGRSLPLGHLRRVFPKGEFYLHLLMGKNRDRFAPDYGIGENGALHADLGHDVIERALANHPPPLMPGNDFVFAGRYLGQLEVASLIGHRIVGMPRDDHLAVHPNVHVTAQADGALAHHGTCDLLTGGG